MKNLIKIIAIFILLLGIYQTNASVDFDSVQGIKNITDHSLTNIDSSGTISDNIEKVGFSLLTTIKYIISGVLVIFIVYIGITMIISMGTDEDKLSTSKRQLYYTIIGLIFINIPGTIYNIFLSRKGSIDGTINGTWSSELVQNQENIFINIFEFDKTINGGIILFIETFIFGIAIFMIVLSGIKIMISRGKDEDITEAKNKILWSLVGLVFIGFIQVWQRFIYTGDISDGANIFETVEQLALFFAGPIAIFFLTLAGYYYITSNGDEDKIKKAKSIIINTVIATIILLASHTFLKELLSF